MAFLYDILVQEFGKRAIAQVVAVPNHITDNLKPGFGQRPYQQEAFQRFTLCDSGNFDVKPNNYRPDFTDWTTSFPGIRDFTGAR